MKQKRKVHPFTFYFYSLSSTAPKAFSVTNCAAVKPVTPVIFIPSYGLGDVYDGLFGVAVFLDTHPSIHSKA
ncbi:hypothetical protein [Nostoc sp.]|uniref:hypothetical protein n=1 Tax=Nostoc sp. TaxID=1180 RepID=UPI002FF51C7B